jgi:hypothetical protein
MIQWPKGFSVLSGIVITLVIYKIYCIINSKILNAWWLEEDMLIEGQNGFRSGQVL